MNALTVARRRLASDEAGITLVELVIVILIVTVLLLVAVSSLLGARERAHETTAEANLRVIVPSIEAYYVDHRTYETMTLAALKTNYDGGIEPALYSFGSAGNLTETSYCVESTSGGRTWRKAGPSADMVPGACP